MGHAKNGGFSALKELAESVYIGDRLAIEDSNVQGVLDGNIDRFIEGYLKWKLGQGNEK